MSMLNALVRVIFKCHEGWGYRDYGCVVGKIGPEKWICTVGFFISICDSVSGQKCLLACNMSIITANIMYS